jgi:hypothetical protein
MNGKKEPYSQLFDDMRLREENILSSSREVLPTGKEKPLEEASPLEDTARYEEFGLDTKGHLLRGFLDFKQKIYFRPRNINEQSVAEGKSKQSSNKQNNSSLDWTEYGQALANGVPQIAEFVAEFGQKIGVVIGSVFDTLTLFLTKGIHNAIKWGLDPKGYKPAYLDSGIGWLTGKLGYFAGYGLGALIGFFIVMAYAQSIEFAPAPADANNAPEVLPQTEGSTYSDVISATKKKATPPPKFYEAGMNKMLNDHAKTSTSPATEGNIDNGQYGRIGYQKGFRALLTDKADGLWDFLCKLFTESKKDPEEDLSQEDDFKDINVETLAIIMSDVADSTVKYHFSS